MLCVIFMFFSVFSICSRHRKNAYVFELLYSMVEMVFNVQYLMYIVHVTEIRYVSRLPIFRKYIWTVKMNIIWTSDLFTIHDANFFIFHVQSHIQANIFVKYKSFLFFSSRVQCTWYIFFFPVRLSFSSLFSSVYFHPIVHQQKV